MSEEPGVDPVRESGSVESVSGRLQPQVDLFVGLGLMLFGAYVAFESWRMPSTEHPRIQFVYEGPGVVPGLLGLVILFFGTLILVRALREGGLHLEGAGGRVAAMFRRAEPRRLLWLLALSLLYAGALIGRVHFLAGTFIFVLAFILVFDWGAAPTHKGRIRLAVTAALQAALTALVVWYVFENIFLVRLP
jgi:hypothetical protein